MVDSVLRKIDKNNLLNKAGYSCGSICPSVRQKCYESTTLKIIRDHISSCEKLLK
jgi:hypothetical protein